MRRYYGQGLAAALLLALAAAGAAIAPRGELERGDTTVQRRLPSAAAPPQPPPDFPASLAMSLHEAAADRGSLKAFPAAPLPDPCALFAGRMPAVTRGQCEQTQLVPSGVASVKGVPLFWRDVTARGALQDGAEAEPLRVLVVGAIHGDELTAASLALRWIDLAQHEALPVHWRFVPVLNPDGLLARNPTRVNANGVDLNRNFPTPGWAQEAPRYWEKRARRDPRRWPGPQPLSEPESQFLHAQMAEFQPQLIVSIHAPYGVLDFDGPLAPPERLGRLWLDQVGVFPGSLGHYGGIHRGMPVVTLELSHALRMPDDAEVLSMWRDLVRWMARHWPQVDPG